MTIACALAAAPAESDNTITNGVNSSPFPAVEGAEPPGLVLPGFLFEPEVPLASLKTVPTWNEIEQLLDNPYLIQLCTLSSAPAQYLIQNTPGTDQNFPSVCTTSGLTRRPGFGVTLPPFLIDPLNYNPTTGERMHLLNPNYPGGPFSIPDELVLTGPATYEWTFKDITVTPGSERIEEGAHEIDYNANLLAGDPRTCISSIEMVPPEGTTLCGRDPGEPRGYSRPAVNTIVSDTTQLGRIANNLLGALGPLRDPESGSVILPRNPINGGGGLKKPSLRIPPYGTPNAPGYAHNTDPDDIAPSNENDFVRDRTLAAVLGKAFFWDMQVGSDAVQSCGSCHAHAGADNRTKNQLNPNHLGPKQFTALIDVNGHSGANQELTREDFPFHKLANPDVAGDPACTTAIVAHVDGGVLENTPNALTGATGTAATGVNMVVCNASNSVKDTDDVASSMGVHFGRFKDIPPIGTFGPPSTIGAVRSVLPDLRWTALDGVPDVLDPLQDFFGSTGNEFRRVEPRNTPTIFAAAFNFDNFWDGRARHDFNGGSVFGASDPQSHVFASSGASSALTETRQLIRFSSLASLATGPGLSEFEMSFQGRNWSKIGKKLLQANVTPLANQLVDANDSILGPYSNQRLANSACASLPAGDLSPGTRAVGKPGLCINYQALIRRSFYPALWQNTQRHLNGCYTQNDAIHHPETNAAHLCPASIDDPFDGFALVPASGAASPTDTYQFTQMEANFSLFWGLALNTWVVLLVPDNTPFDQFLDANPDSFLSLGEPGEAGLVPTQPLCGANPMQRNCMRQTGLFKRNRSATNPNGRLPSDPDPLLGLDLFEASNLSGRNPNFRSARCGECHAVPTLTDHTVPFTFKAQLRDFTPESTSPGEELPLEPLGRLRMISGFLLESEMNENGQDGVERRIANQSILPCSQDGLAYPGGLEPGSGDGFGPCAGAAAGYFDNGIYNLGIRPIAEDVGRGGDDAFGWPLSLAALMLKNLGGTSYDPGGGANDPNGFGNNQGAALSTFTCENDPCHEVEDADGDLFEETAQDQQINPGVEGEPANPLLPPYLAPWIAQINVGDAAPDLDEINSGINTLTDVPMLEGFLDALGPLNPAGLGNEALNMGEGPQMGTWPGVNRVGRSGSFKAAQLREVELTGPYFHNGGKLTLRQVVDFYTRGGDFPMTNAAHRDFNLVNQNVEVQSNLSEAEKVALVDFLLTLTDDRVKYERAPFDHPEVILPLDGRAPENTSGRETMLTGCVDLPVPQGRQCVPANDGSFMFRVVPAVGSNGNPSSAPLPNFLDIKGTDANGVPAQRLSGPAAFCGANVTSQYCH